MNAVIDPKPEKKVKQIKISAIYVPPAQWEMLNLAWIHLGYSPRMIAKNCLQDFFTRNKNYYIGAAIRDADSRGIDQAKHYKILRNSQNLPRIIDAADHPASPIAWVPDLVNIDNKRRYNSIELSWYNWVLLQMAVLLDGGSLPSVISKCIYAHLGESYELKPSDNLRVGAWAQFYYPQIRLDKKNSYYQG